ncbi:MAG: DsbA family protein [Candidatus Paceibacterota bacterium]
MESETQHEHITHEHHHPHSTSKQNPWAIPLAIVLAGGIVALAVFYSGKAPTSPTAKNAQGTTQQDIKVRPIDSTDHIIGDPNAPIKIVEYSDLECPYCQVFHATMEQVMKDYEGKVAWVYRSFWSVRKLPDGSTFHPLGGKAAESAECVAELGGNDKFWDYMGKVFADQANGSLENLSKYATAEGIDKTAFDKCLSSGKYTAKVESLYQEGLKSQVNGTPNAFVISKNGIIVIPGAVPYAQVKAALDNIIKNQ